MASIFVKYPGLTSPTSTARGFEGTTECLHADLVTATLDEDGVALGTPQRTLELERVSDHNSAAFVASLVGRRAGALEVYLVAGPSVVEIRSDAATVTDYVVGGGDGGGSSTDRITLSLRDVVVTDRVSGVKGGLRGAGRPLLEASFHTDGPGATLLPELHAALSGRSSLKAFWEEERLFSGAPQVTLSATLSGLVVGRVQTSRSEGASLTTYSALMPLTRADLAWFTG